MESGIVTQEYAKKENIRFFSPSKLYSS